jgi:hypothetical protein
MNIRKKIVAVLIFFLILVTGIFWFVPDRAIQEGMLIVTAVPSGIDLENENLGIDKRYIPEARILVVDPQDPANEPLTLTEEFYSARSPEVSYDGREMVFTAQKSENDTWQIYVKDLETFQVKQVTRCPVNCTDPVWLPDGRIGFSRLNDGEVPGQDPCALCLLSRRISHGKAYLPSQFGYFFLRNNGRKDYRIKWTAISRRRTETDDGTPY